MVEEPRLVGSKDSGLRLGRRGLTSEDQTMVLHPIYFRAADYDPFYGPPGDQPEFADWLDLSRSKHHAEQQTAGPATRSSSDLPSPRALSSQPEPT